MHASTTYPYPRAERSAARRASTGARYFLPAVAALVGAAWLVSRYADYTPGSDLGYSLGLAGGVALLLVFLYPLRKRLRFMQGLGREQGMVRAAHGLRHRRAVPRPAAFALPGRLGQRRGRACQHAAGRRERHRRALHLRAHPPWLYGTRMTLAQLQAEVGSMPGVQPS